MAGGPGGRWLGVGTLLLALLALLAAARGSIIMIYLAVAYQREVDPISEPLSLYVFVEGGAELYNSAAVALAVGMLAVLVGMTRAGVHLAGRPTVLFSVWALCLVLSAVFPTDQAEYVETFTGWVHQFAGAGILALLSFAGFAAAPRWAEIPAWRPVVGIVRALSGGAAVLAVAYVVSRLNDWFPALSSLTFGVDLGGILQRMVLGFDAAVILALAVHLVRVSWPAVRTRAEPLRTEPGPQPVTPGP